MKQAGLRTTHVRKHIFAVLLGASQPLSIQTIVAQLPTAHYVSIYRSVDALHKAGIIKQVPRGFKNTFELSDMFKPHHHHATCESCGKSVEISDKRLEDLMRLLSVEAGLQPTRHHFELFGVCRLCS